MNRPRIIVLALCPALIGLLTLAGSCASEKSESTRRPISEIIAPEEKPTPEAGAPPDVGVLEVGDASMLEVLRDIKTVPQGIQALLASYEIEIREIELAQSLGNSVPLKAFCNDVIKEVKEERLRLRQLAADKDITPESTLLTDRMKFESQAAMVHLRSIFTYMFETSFCSRRIESNNTLLRLIDEQILPVFAEDAELKAEVVQVRNEVEKRRNRAERLQSGLADGPGGSEGMFKEDAFDPKPVRKPTSVTPTVKTDAGAAPVAAPAPTSSASPPAPAASDGGQ